MQQQTVTVRAVRGPNGVLIDIDGPCGQKAIYTANEAVHVGLLMLAVAGTAFDSAVEFAATIDRARAAIALQPSGSPLHYQPSPESLAAERPQ